MKNKMLLKIHEIISNTTTFYLDLVQTEKELKYIKTYSVNLYVKHSTLLGLLILTKNENSPNISLTFFSSKSFFLQKYGPKYVDCHI